jgi:hypothetical protein
MVKMVVLKDFFTVVMALLIYAIYIYLIYVIIQSGLWILMFIPIMLVGLIVNLIVIIVRKNGLLKELQNLRTPGNAITTRAETIRNFNESNFPVSSMLLTPSQCAQNW